jgi:rubrerythrin
LIETEIRGEVSSTTTSAALPVDLVCASCGYGVAAWRAPAVCPMCGLEAWEPAAWRPFKGRRGEAEPTD